MDKNCYVVLMAGGSGTRFWPHSRSKKPKQFLDILGTGKTLIQSTYERFLSTCRKENIFVVIRQDHFELTKEQLELDDAQILVEPFGKNTAPCIAYSCYRIAKENARAVVIVAPSDHIILNENKFDQTMEIATEYAVKHDNLITIGISPTRPETGYGYIHYERADDSPIKKVLNFTEKPPLSRAKQFVESGDYVWNSGIFVWGVQTIITAIEKHQPQLASLFEQASSVLYTDRERAMINKIYAQCENISIDYGIIEKASNVCVYLGDFSWSDLGSWESLHAVREKDDNDNVIDAKAMVYDVKNSIIKGDKDKLMVIQGLDGYLIGEFDDVIVVCKKDREELFRQFARDIRSRDAYSGYL